MSERVTGIGGGLAGCEAAWQLASRGVPVDLYEMRPVRGTEAHQTDRLGELVCSNSFRNASLETAIGCLKEEMRRLSSLVLAIADETSVPAGAALAVDRELFAARLTGAIEQHPGIRLVRQEMHALPADGVTIVATGPLTSPAFSAALERAVYFEGCMPIEEMARRGRETLAFGPMRPVGLVNPRTGRRPHAVVQLRQDNHAATLYNLVGFQTKMTYPEQRRVLRMIPGLGQAEFVRLGRDRKSTRLNSSHLGISYAVFCLKKKNQTTVRGRGYDKQRTETPYQRM